MGFEIKKGILKKYTDDNVKEVIIPEGVEEIGKFAFCSCQKIESVIIPESVIKIGRYAFADCRNLRHIKIPDGVKKIAKGTFYGCVKLEDITIPCGIEKIGKKAFGWCVNLHNIKIPDTVKKLGNGAFYLCTSLKSIVIPDGIKEIKNNMFSGCIRLENIRIPDSVTKIEDKVFEACQSLKNLDIPGNLTSVGDNLLLKSEYIKYINISGYTLDLTSCYYETIRLSDILYILSSEDYSMPIDDLIKYQLAVQLFLKKGGQNSKAYIEDNITEIIQYFINKNDYDVIKGLFDSDEFITKENIMYFAHYAIENTQKGGDLQIQAYIMDYKNRKFPDLDPMENLKL